MVPSCKPGTKTSTSPHQPDAWLPRQPGDAPETMSGTLCPSFCCFLGSSNDCRKTVSSGHLGGRVPCSSPFFKQIAHLPRTRLSRQRSSRRPAAASLELPLGSAFQFKGLLVHFSRRQQHPSRQRKHSGVPLRVARWSGTQDPARPGSQLQLWLLLAP